MDPRFSPITVSGNMSLYNIGDIFNLPASMDLLDDEDFESTMMMLDNSAFRGEDSDNLELNLIGLSDAFNSQETGSPRATSEQHSMSAHGPGFPVDVNSCLSPDLKIRSSGRTPVGGDVYIKQESAMPGYSPVIDSFLRESWDGIVRPGSRSAQASFKPTNSCSSSLTISVTPGRVNPLPLSYLLPIPSPLGDQPLTKNMPYIAPSLPLPPPTLRTVSNSSTSSTVSSASSARSKSTRRAKQCIAEECTRRAQSNNRCKTHGGGARCQVEGCDKSSQGGVFVVLTVVARSAAYLAAQKGPSALVCATYTVESVAALWRAARRRTVVMATASRTEVVGGARLRTAIGQFARGTTANYTKVELKTPRSRLVGARA
ncbi:hypothetical protein PI124_g12876 [Phytophthora idaei]|nr:hypothetical protein PI125_g12370 [Phytophthora idaei]KAG3150621.1 hypothetical protein PI126_g11415 [Phytophthora idaei]KAG3242285.1 hypothetical protein PI124_g12876 [Phytophthora idaei]